MAVEQCITSCTVDTGQELQIMFNVHSVNTLESNVWVLYSAVSWPILNHMVQISMPQSKSQRSAEIHDAQQLVCPSNDSNQLDTYLGEIPLDWTEKKKKTI